MPAAVALRKIDPTLPGSCRLSSTADTLSGCVTARSGVSMREEYAHAVFDLAHRVVQRVGQAQYVRALAFQLADDVRHFRVLQGAFADDALFRHAPQLQVRLAQMHAVEQGAASTCGAPANRSASFSANPCIAHCRAK